MIVVACASIAPQRWKNGGGSLRELLLRPAGASWQLRIALAAIDADGPFSEFAGVTRHFAVVGGGGVELTVDNAGAVTRHRLRPGDPPLRFDGGAATGCRLLDGHASALNLMLRGADGGIEPAAAGRQWLPAAASCGLYAAAAGCCNGIELPADSLLWFDSAPAMLRFDVERGPASAGPPGWWLAATLGQGRP